jgi:hypothetical protein
MFEKLVELVRRGSARPLAAACAVLAISVLAACGGGSENAGTPPFGGGSGGGGTTTPVVASLSLVLVDANGAPASSLNNIETARLTAKVTALDKNNAIVPNAPIAFAANNGGVVAPASTTTDDQGLITALVGIGADRSSRTITVTVTGENGSVSSSAEFVVTGAKLTAAVSPIVVPGAEINATFTLVDASANPMPQETVTLAAGGTTVGEQKTDSTGKTTFKFAAPAAPTSLTLRATAAGESIDVIVQVQSTSVPPAAGTISGASVSANPSVVSVNSTGTSNSTTIRALFKGANNAPIANVRVWFTLPDPNTVGGSIADSGLVYSDATGTATTTYVPGPVSSPTDGVVVLACYSNNDFVAPAPGTKTCPAGTQSAQTTLTVVDEALRLSIGTDELIGLGTVTYYKDYTVIVVDAAGRAKADVEITPKLDLTAYYKGYYGWDGESWTRAPGVGLLLVPLCPNEDVNRNGNKEAGEDTNGNGELDPAGVSIRMNGSSRTDASGKAIVRIEYPRDRATWIDYLITVTGRVGGSEGLAIYRGSLDGLGNLPAPGEVFKNQNVFPAFGISPYGRLPAASTDPNLDGLGHCRTQ